MRYIALPEFQPNFSQIITPPSSYIENTNGTLEAIPSRLITDENGFMVSERSLQQGDFRVLLLGGSSIENIYIHHDYRIFSSIEKIMVEEACSTKVFNTGISGAHLLHCINILINKGIKVRPHCVVLYPTQWTDMMANEVDGTFWNPAGRLATVRKLGADLDMELNAPILDRDSFDDQKRLLKSLVEICKNFGSQLCLATWPLYGAFDDHIRLFQTEDAEHFYRQEAQHKKINEVISQVCDETMTPLIDLEQVFESLDHDTYFYDRYHPNTKGCAVIARATSSALKGCYIQMNGEML